MQHEQVTHETTIDGSLISFVTIPGDSDLDMTGEKTIPDLIRSMETLYSHVDCLTNQGEMITAAATYDKL